MKTTTKANGTLAATQAARDGVQFMKLGKALVAIEDALAALGDDEPELRHQLETVATEAVPVFAALAVAHIRECQRH